MGLDEPQDDGYETESNQPFNARKRGKTGTESYKSTSGIQQPVTVSWTGIHAYAPASVVKTFWRRSPNKPGVEKHILKNVNGIVNPGSLFAIMGASGAGKTTLMNVLASRSEKNLRIEGSVKVNGKEIGSNIKYISAYVQQDDVFVPSLTVKEHLWFSTQLRIKGDVPDSVRKQKVDDVMKELGLTELENFRIGLREEANSISGGERKRLSFASEILTNPPLMFCDEPTSGLDSYMAQTVIETLRDLASNGRTILCTIHQPSSAVYQLMDKVCLMAEGQVASMGSANAVMDYFDRIGYTCPKSYNPADFYIHTLAVIPGQEEQCRQKVKEICDSYEQSGAYQETMRAIDKTNSYFSFLREIGTPFEDGRSKALKAKASRWTQFHLLFWRAWTDNARTPAQSRARIFQMIAIAIFTCLLYYGQRNDQNGVMNMNGALFAFIIQLTICQMYMVACTLPLEYPLFLREHDSGMYRVDAYYFSHVLAELPIFILNPLIFSAFVYFTIGFYQSTEAFITLYFALLMCTLCTVSFGHLLCTLTCNAVFTVALVPAFSNIFMLVGGFLINVASIPVYMKPLGWISWFQYCYEILVVNQWQNVDSLECETAVRTVINGTVTLDTSACYYDGQEVIESLSFSEDGVLPDIINLVVLVVVYELLAFLFLYLRSRRK